MKIIQIPFFRIKYLLIFALFILVSCADQPVEPEPEVVPEGAWITWSPYKWSHDGNPYISKHCIVFSDGASAELKTQAGLFADNIFEDIIQLFEFTSQNDFRYPPDHNKIDIYLNVHHDERIAAAYWGCIFITLRSGNDNISQYEYVMRHELTHAFEYLIEGTPELGTDVWFREGIAIYGGGGRNYIKTVEDLEYWVASNSQYPNLGNPITIHQWEDFPDGADIPGYYTVFDLSMKYLLDSNGYNKTCQDVLNVFYMVRNGSSFRYALRTSFNISIEELEQEIFDRLRSYLAEQPSSGTSIKLKPTDLIEPSP